jgi:DNA-binding beta-propeller fold protein YncE
MRGRIVRWALLLVAYAGLAAPGAAGAGSWKALTSNNTQALPGTPGSASPIDLTSDLAGGPVGLGASGEHLAISPDGRTAYVAASAGCTATSNSVEVVDLSSSPARAARRISLGTGVSPTGLAISPDGGTVYVSSSCDGSVIPIDVTQSPPVLGAHIKVGPNPQNLAIAADGRTLYVSDESGGAVVVLDLTPLVPVLTRTIPVAGNPGAMALSPDGRTLYLAREHSCSITPIDTVTGAPSTPIALGTFSCANGSSPYGDPASIAIGPDGGRLYASSPDGGTVATIDTATRTERAPLTFRSPTSSIPFEPVGLALTPDGQRLLVTDGLAGPTAFGNQVAILDLTTSIYATVLLGSAISGAPFDIAVTPDQAPVASFMVAPAAPGSPTAFDASSSTVAAGTIAVYAWNFGDGSTQFTTTPKTTHIYRNAGLFTATVTETDSAGTSTVASTLGTGRSLARDGNSSAQSSGTFVVGKSSVTPPVEGKTALASPVFGTVLVRHGHGPFRRLTSLADISMGSELDTTAGAVRLIVAHDRRGATDAVTVSGGRFIVRQSKGARPVTSFALSEPLTGCTHAASVASVSKRRPKRRHIKVQETSGNYATKGQYIATSVEGTIWDTADACGTSTAHVFQGTVTVTDLVRHRHSLLHAGQSYTAHAKR